jgi:uncharacterized membrane protein YhdT
VYVKFGSEKQSRLALHGLIVWALVFAPAALLSSTHAIELPRSFGRVFDIPLLVVSLAFGAVMIWRSRLRLRMRRPLWLPGLLALYLEVIALASLCLAAIHPTKTRAVVAFPFVVAGAAMGLAIAFALLRDASSSRGAAVG